MNLENSAIQDLGELTEISGNLNIVGCYNLLSLGNKLERIKGGFYSKGDKKYNPKPSVLKDLGSLKIIDGDCDFPTSLETLGNLERINGAANFPNSLKSIGNLQYVKESFMPEHLQEQYDKRKNEVRYQEFAPSFYSRLEQEINNF